MPRKEPVSRRAERSAQVARRAREAVREEIEHMGEGGRETASVSYAVARGLAEARRVGAKAELAREEVDEIAWAQARRVLADEQPGRGRRSGKKSRATTQILKNAEPIARARDGSPRRRGGRRGGGPA